MNKLGTINWRAGRSGLLTLCAGISAFGAAGLVWIGVEQAMDGTLMAAHAAEPAKASHILGIAAWLMCVIITSLRVYWRNEA